ncbi:MAG: hypothetical protein NVV69_12620 [Methyloversatilis sp.]|uniref:hypothetical protein n=1 Tax=Methyloversatilis sp. TaxID=2569862 RepID=UPI0025E7447C|nr:hypothetical protein [Methyloversatilis sp.]MCR6666828.1 hypothetical protein [Methyloversatilis sp.]
MPAVSVRVVLVSRLKPEVAVDTEPAPQATLVELPVPLSPHTCMMVPVDGSDTKAACEGAAMPVRASAPAAQIRRCFMVLSLGGQAVETGTGWSRYADFRYDGGRRQCRRP